MSFNVSIDDFNGPLDLMLHLVKENKLDLFDLDIRVLSEQYLKYLMHFEKMHLEIASEYLVELATLIEYKSKQLLPGSTDELESNYEEDLKETMMKRLIEYQKFKEIIPILETQYLQRQKHYAKVLSDDEKWHTSLQENIQQGTPYDLLKAMQRCLKRQAIFKPLATRVTKKEYSVSDRKYEIVKKMKQLPKTFQFEALLDDVVETNQLIVTFLAILDLVKTHQLYFEVDKNETIWFTGGN